MAALMSAALHSMAFSKERRCGHQVLPYCSRAVTEACSRCSLAAARLTASIYGQQSPCEPLCACKAESMLN
eukprot:5587447-Pleurochrysis_carterae.AAC.2